MEGKVGEILSLRDRYLTNKKMTKDEAVSAYKVLNEEQLEYLKERDRLKYKEVGLNQISSLSNLAKKNSERRKAERSKKNGN